MMLLPTERAQKETRRAIIERLLERPGMMLFERMGLVAELNALDKSLARHGEEG